jgi:hypothetical protein
MYGVGRDALGRQTVQVMPFFGDARKKPKPEVIGIDDAMADVERVKVITREIRVYLFPPPEEADVEVIA